MARQHPGLLGDIRRAWPLLVVAIPVLILLGAIHWRLASHIAAAREPTAGLRDVARLARQQQQQQLLVGLPPPGLLPSVQPQEGVLGGGGGVAAGAGRGGGGGAIFHLLLMYDRVPEKVMCTIETLLAATAGTGSELWLWVKPGWEGKREFLAMLGTIGYVLQRTGVPQRVSVHPLYYASLMKDTPLEAFYDGRALDAGLALGEKYGRLATQALSNAIRLAILWHHGGFYMDCDIIVLRDPSTLASGFPSEMIGGWVESGADQPKMEKPMVNNDALYFRKPRHALVRAILERFVAHYSGWRWGATGPLTLTPAFNDWTEACNDTAVCPDAGSVQAWERIAASSVSFRRCEKLLMNNRTRNLDYEKEIRETAIMVHTHNHECGEFEDYLLGTCANASDPRVCYHSTFVGDLKLDFCPLASQRMMLLAARGEIGRGPPPQKMDRFGKHTKPKEKGESKPRGGGGG